MVGPVNQEAAQRRQRGSADAGPSGSKSRGTVHATLPQDRAPPGALQALPRRGALGRNYTPMLQAAALSAAMPFLRLLDAETAHQLALRALNLGLVAAP